MTSFSRDDGFTLTEMMVSTAVMLLVAGGAMTTFKNALDINDAASQLGDTNQNLRAGTNQLDRDLMMAGRIISNGGVPAPAGVGASAIKRPGPVGSNLTFAFVQDDDGTLMIPSVTPGYQLGPAVNPGNTTDIVTILTIDEFEPFMVGVGAGTPLAGQALISAGGDQITVPVSSPWLIGDATNDTQPLHVGDIILFKNINGMAMQTVTAINVGTGVISFGASDWFNLNQRNASYTGTVLCIKAADTCDPNATPATSPVPTATVTAAWPATAASPGGGTALMRLLMITYYVDNTTTPGTPRLTKMINNYTPQALAGVVEDLDLTYDLVNNGDPTQTVSNLPTLPTTINGVKYTANMIKKVNVHLGVRSQFMSKPTLNYIRNHISTSVGVRSMSDVDRYDTTANPGS